MKSHLDAAFLELPSPGTQQSAYPSTILVVDDSPLTRRALTRALESFAHKVVGASGAVEALECLTDKIDLVLLDVTMPGMDGFELTRAIRVGERPDVPIIMVTGRDTASDRLRAVEAGVNDFVGKPFNIAELRLRTEAQLRFKLSVDAIKQQCTQSEFAAQARAADLREVIDSLRRSRKGTAVAHLNALHSLVLAAEYGDCETAQHIERVGLFAGIVASELKLPEEVVKLVAQTSPMHDIGKVGVPDAVLLKAGPLDALERAAMREHAVIGARILGDSEAPLIRMARDVALCHHEWWDGSGYPNQLIGEAIPLAARICAVVDVFDALTSERRYRSALPTDQVQGMLAKERGSHFDPRVLDAFFVRRPEIEAIQGHYETL